jgi:hypothetical protein
MAGKGSRPRPFSVPLDEYNKNLTAIFGEKPKKEPYVPPPLPEDMQNIKSSHDIALGKDTK